MSLGRCILCGDLFVESLPGSYVFCVRHSSPSAQRRWLEERERAKESHK